MLPELPVTLMLLDAISAIIALLFPARSLTNPTHVYVITNQASKQCPLKGRCFETREEAIRTYLSSLNVFKECCVLLGVLLTQN